MAKDETAAEREERVSKELREQYEGEAEDITKAAKDARGDEPEEEGFQTWEQYREHSANVPGVFGDTDTSGTAPEVDSVVTSNEEQAGVAVARVDEARVTGTDEEKEEVEGATAAEAKRQVDVAGPQPSAEEVQAGADEVSDSEPATAKELVAEANSTEDRERLDELAQDDRKTVREAAEARKEELDSE